MLVEKEALKERWAKYFEELLNVEGDREAEIYESKTSRCKGELAGRAEQCMLRWREWRRIGW